MISRRHVLGALGVLGAGAGIGGLVWMRRTGPAAPAAGACGSLAGGRIRWIVPHAAGGGYDSESRLIEPFLERRLRSEVVIDNVPGASGLIGARAIASAAPDGRTLGILGAPGLLIAELTGVKDALAPDAFTILGRVSRSWHVWATGRDSSLRTLDDALAAARARPLVFALSEVTGVNFVSAGVTASLLGAPITMVPGFQGSQAAALAAVRGDVDLVSFDFETIRGLIASGDLRPLLQVSDRPIDPSIEGVPLLGGPQGWIAHRVQTPGDGVDRDLALTTALIEVISAGRIVVAPAGLEPSMSRCLDEALHATLSSDALQAAASRSLDIGTGEQARAEVLAARADLPLLWKPLQDALAAVRS